MSYEVLVEWMAKIGVGTLAMFALYAHWKGIWVWKSELDRREADRLKTEQRLENELKVANARGDAWKRVAVELAQTSNNFAKLFDPGVPDPPVSNVKPSTITPPTPATPVAPVPGPVATSDAGRSRSADDDAVQPRTKDEAGLRGQDAGLRDEGKPV